MTQVGNRALPCPRCGYDLRGSPRVPTGVRCSECGTITPLAGPNALTTSRVPWVGRRARGRVRTFILTVWLVVAKPQLLAREVEVAARLRDGRRFRMICLGVATMVATVWLLIGRDQTDVYGWLPPVIDFPDLLPAEILLDRWYGVVLLTSGTWVAFWLCLEFYRGIVCLGGVPGPRYVRRRLSSLSQYSGGLFLVESFFVVPAWLLWLDRAHLRTVILLMPANITERRNLLVAVIVLSLLAASIHLWASLPLVLRTGRWRVLRAILMTIYPVAAFCLWIAIVTAINWAVGFVVLAVYTMIF